MTETNPIYHYRASDDLGDEAWGTLRDAVLGGGMTTWDEIKPQFAAWEDDFKKATGLPIPGAYRSAKSVLKSAVVLGLPYAGSAKTALEKMIKVRKEAEKEVTTALEKAQAMAGRLQTYCEQHGMSCYVTIETSKAA